MPSARPVGRLPQAEVRKKKKGIQQTRAVYSSELMSMNKKNIYKKEVQGVKTVKTRPLSLTKIKKPVALPIRLAPVIAPVKLTLQKPRLRKMKKLVPRGKARAIYNKEPKIKKISEQIPEKSHKIHKKIYREVSRHYTSVQFEQEPEQKLQEELTALKKTGDWRSRRPRKRSKSSKLGGAKQSLLTSASFSSFFSDEIQQSAFDLTLPTLPNSFTPVQFTIENISAQVFEKIHKDIYGEFPKLYAPMQFEQEPEQKLQEEFIALKETGDWRSHPHKRKKSSKLGGARQSLLTSASFSSFFSDEIQQSAFDLTLPTLSNSFAPVQFTIENISAQVSKKIYKNIYEEPSNLYISVQFEQEPEQELQEELTALKETGDWRSRPHERSKSSKFAGARQSLLTSASFSSFFSDEIQQSAFDLTLPTLPNSFTPVQFNGEIDFISLLAKNSVKEQAQDVSLGTKTVISDFPIIVNKQVEFYLNKFQNEQRETFEALLKRAALYLPLIEQELNKAKLPKALINLAMIESGFNPTAYSPAGATGLWQFMPTTAKSYGLRIDSWIDERRNPEKATKAAISYLSALYKQFGDWQLAVAAYNAGEGKILRGLEKYKVKNFWELAEKNYLPLETKRYVPKLIAAIIIAHEPKRYGFQPVSEKKMEYDVIDVPSRTPLATVAKAGGYSVKEIRQLNNELLKNQIPPVKNMYSLRVPAGSSTHIAANIAENIQESRSDKKKKVVHRLQRGETLSGVSKRYNVSVNMIMQWNDIDDVRRIHTGRKLALYPHNKFDAGKGQVEVEKMDVSYYKVRHGDSLWSIARKHQVSTRDIKQWNQLNNNLLHPGKKLVIKKS
ncbi:transglycosylase SLT domain-containing protein [Desulfobulbus sp. TB]|nr:transglycosylase SLT domain-containing protein [Desulfobulbus sp. TB]